MREDIQLTKGFPCGSGKEFAGNAGDAADVVPSLGRDDP